MSRRLTINFDMEEHGYAYEIQPVDVPMVVVVEVLMGFLEDLKTQYDSAPGLHPSDASTWQALGRIKFVA